MNTVVENVRPTVQELEESIRMRRRGCRSSANDVDRRFFCPNPTCHEKKTWFRSQKMLNQHYTKVHKDKALKCPTCDRTFALPRDLKYHHKKQHSVEASPAKPHAPRLREWACKTCNKTFQRQYELNDHVRSEHERHEKRYECILCERSFETEDEVEIHFKNIHPDLIGFNVGCNTEPEERERPDEELDFIMNKYLPIQPRPPIPTMDETGNLEIPCSSGLLCAQDYELQMVCDPWRDENYASTQTDYNSAQFASSYCQTEQMVLYNDSSAIPQYEYSDYGYMDRQDFGAQTYYVETQDFGTQMDGQPPMLWCSMERNYDEGPDPNAPIMDSGMCHVGTTSYYSEWTRHTETQTEGYYYSYQAPPQNDPIATFSNGSTQTNEVTYSNRMV
ncbi:hypothetical protein L596_004456 [Steinernema carpocapsae]|uniref:C2H2-type domain-containing protein n=1 Tax=Steinernema carpocapsae TaxID=34508 RepID=A0A4U8UZG1_STECR|nr:hypothetical protein L596_004456 [Steinernema carpocapsae]